MMDVWVGFSLAPPPLCIKPWYCNLADKQLAPDRHPALSFSGVQKLGRFVFLELGWRRVEETGLLL